MQTGLTWTWTWLRFPNTCCEATPENSRIREFRNSIISANFLFSFSFLLLTHFFIDISVNRAFNNRMAVLNPFTDLVRMLLHSSKECSPLPIQWHSTIVCNFKDNSNHNSLLSKRVQEKAYWMFLIRLLDSLLPFHFFQDYLLVV